MPYTLIRARPGKLFRETMRVKMREHTLFHLSTANRLRGWWRNGHGLKRFPYDTIMVDESTVCRSSVATLEGAGEDRTAGQASPPAQRHARPGRHAGSVCANLLAGWRRAVRAQHHPFPRKLLVAAPYSWGWKPQANAVERVAAKIADICFILKEEDAGIDVHKPLVIERPIVLEKAELTRYRDFERELILQLENVEIEAVNAGVLSMKLLQYASGAVYDADRNVHIIHNHKLTELENIIAENPGENIIVAYWFRTSLQRLQKAFPKAVQMDKEGARVADWNAGKIPILLLHPQSAGHGLNLQFGGRMMVFMTRLRLSSFIFRLSSALLVRGRPSWSRWCIWLHAKLSSRKPCRS
jgi:hypothetical protein